MADVSIIPEVRYTCTSMIRIIAVGKKHERWIQDGLKHYQERLRAPWNIEWVLLPHSPAEGDRARQEESERILARVSRDDFLILLDERGKNLTSPALAALLHDQFTHSQPVVVIGGAYGVTDQLRHHADIVWSLSNLVFPHQLVRLLLIEQLYRAQEITRGSNYHHE